MCDREACNEGAYSNLLEQQEAAIQRVLDMHFEFIPGCCHGCPTIEHGRQAWASYPCETRRILEGDQ